MLLTLCLSNNIPHSYRSVVTHRQYPVLPMMCHQTVWISCTNKSMSCQNTEEKRSFRQSRQVQKRVWFSEDV